MEITDYILIIRRRWVWVVSVTLLGALIGLTLAFALPKTYVASTRQFFTVQGGESISDLNEGSSFVQEQMSSYAQVASSPIVLNPVIEQFGLADTPEELAESVRATVPAETVVLDVEVEQHDANQAAEVANALAAQLKAAVAELSPRDGEKNQVVVASVIADAAVPEDPSAPNRKLLLAVATLCGVLLGLAAAVTQETLKAPEPEAVKHGAGDS